MEQVVIPSMKGIYSHPNPIGEVPLGAVIEAVNLNMDRDGVLETRRGFKTLTDNSTDVPLGLYFQDGLIYSYLVSGKFQYMDLAGSGKTDLSTSYSAPQGLQSPLSTENGGNYYFTTNLGVIRLERNGNTPSITGRTGAPKGLDGSAVTSGASGWMANNTAVAYRVCFAYVDATGKKHIGSPTSRILATNTSGGTRTVDVTFTLPAELTTSFYYQLYRSVQTSNSTDEPLDEMQLVVEKQPSSAEITAKSITYTDQTPDNLLGATLYTSPSQEGILQANERPPYATSIASYKTLMCYANTATPQRMFMTIISIGGSSGLAVNDTIVIDGVTYTAKATETASSGQFQVYTSGTTSQNIDNTARSLVRVINKYSSNTTVYAYYLSGYQDLPGKILIEHRVAYNTTSFVATSSRGSAFSPPLPSSGTTYASANETKHNRIYFAKSSQQESVPLLNYIDVGSANHEIINIVALRESLIVLKDDSIWRVTGETINDIRSAIFDGTTNVVFPHCCVAFDNKVFAITTQGAVMVSDSGVEVVSRPIERQLLFVINDVLSNGTAPRNCFAIAYQSDRKIIINLSSSYSNALYVGNITYVYSPVTNAWTTWTLPVVCGVTIPGFYVMRSGGLTQKIDKLYIGAYFTDWQSATTKSELQYERKDFYATDYADYEYSITINSITGDVITTNYFGTIGRGYCIGQSGFFWALNPTASGTKVIPRTQASGPAYPSTGAATLYIPITTQTTTTPIHAGHPGISKKFSFVDLMLGATLDDLIAVLFHTDTYGANASTSPASQKIEGSIEDGGNQVFSPRKAVNYLSDSVPVKIQNGRCYVPYAKSRARNLFVTVVGGRALTRLDINGMVLGYVPGSTKLRGAASPLAY